MENINSKDKVFNILTKDFSEWKVCKYHANHKSTGMSFWIANGLTSFKNEGIGVDIGLCNKVRLWFWLKESMRNKIINKSNREAE